jgi:hypothetical protein
MRDAVAALEAFGEPELAIPPLEKILQESEGRSIPGEAAVLLSNLGWQPDGDLAKARLFVGCRSFRKLKELDFGEVEGFLFSWLAAPWGSHYTWAASGEVAAYLVESGLDPSDPRLEETVRELRRIAVMPDRQETRREIAADSFWDRVEETSYTVSEEGPRKQAAALLARMGFTVEEG